ETTLNMLEQAEAMTEKISDGYYKAEAARQIGFVYGDFRKREKSYKALVKAFEITKNRVYKKEDRVRLFEQISSNLMKANYYKKAREVLNMALADIDNVHDVYYKAVLSLRLSLLTSITSADDISDTLFEEAVESTSHMGDAYMRSRMLIQLADYAALKNYDEKSNAFIEEAHTWAKRVGDQYYRVLAFETLSTQLYLMGQDEKAFEMLSEAKTAAKRIGSPYYQAKAYAEIAGALYVYDRHDESIEALELAKTAVNRIGSRLYKVKVMDRMFWIYYILDEKENAATLNSDLYDLAKRAGGYKEITEALLIASDNFAQLKDFDNANIALEQITDL
ncbi:MAG: hypothetical protein ACOCWO_01095, partial [Candidatus Muiribacteriaceae bacterium]